MSHQNVTNYGNFNTSNQYNGDVTLTSLELDELAEEDALARRVIRTERKRRIILSAILAFIALIALVVGYVFFLSRGQLKLADILNNFGPAVAAPLIGLVVSGLVALGSGVGAVKFAHPTETEQLNRLRLPEIKRTALSKGYSRGEWRRVRKLAKRNE